MKPTRTKVVIINGVTGVGKDTFIELASSYCELNECANVLNISSVDPIKDVLYGFGWDGNRTDEVRDLMTGIKKLWVSAQNGPTMFLMNNILQFHMINTGEDNIIFCHVREPEEITKLMNAIGGMESMGIEITTMLIKRDNVTGSERRSDNYDVISQYPYHHIIYNDGDLAKLDEIVCEFVENLF